MPTIKEYFQNIATAIKQKNSEIVTVTPAQMPQAILDIPSGGGGVSFEEPIAFDNHNGYVSAGGSFYYSPNNLYMNDVYLLQLNHIYILTLGNYRGNRFRVGRFNVNIAEVKSNNTGFYIDAQNSPSVLVVKKFMPSDNYLYLGITKDDSGVSGIKTYLIDCTDWS